jgi:KDO2-lipid IV(A) lauroyltransferase
MLSALKQGRVVFVMLDQGVKRAEDGQMQRFLGKDMAMPAGPAQLDRASRAPVLPLVTTAATPKWKFSIEPPVPLGQGSPESDEQTLVALTEQQIQLAPHLWSWHHRRWCKRPLAPNLVA